MNSAPQSSVVCFSSCDEYLLETSAQKLLHFLQQQWEDSEITHISGEDFTLEEAVLAAGTISFFSTKRILYISRLQLSSLDDKTVAEFCDLLKDTENAVVVITAWFKGEKDKKTKKAKQLEDAVRLSGQFMELATPHPGDLKAMAVQMAQEQGCTLNDDAAQELAERVNGDLHLLSNEIAKLAAGTGYSIITRQTVAALAVQTVEADVFRMIDAVTSGKTAQAFAVLDKLIYLRSDPIAIVGAMASSFVDMARVQTGARHKAGYAQVFRELNYTGKEYRLQRAGQTGARYTPAQMATALDLLAQLDFSLKSSPVDSTVLLQTALSELCSLTRMARA